MPTYSSENQVLLLTSSHLLNDWWSDLWPWAHWGWGACWQVDGGLLVRSPVGWGCSTVRRRVGNYLEQLNVLDLVATSGMLTMCHQNVCLVQLWAMMIHQHVLVGSDKRGTRNKTGYQYDIVWSFDPSTDQCRVKALYLSNPSPAIVGVWTDSCHPGQIMASCVLHWE